jgi:hypothetical protein
MTHTFRIDRGDGQTQYIVSLGKRGVAQFCPCWKVCADSKDARGLTAIHQLAHPVVEAKEDVAAVV